VQFWGEGPLIFVIILICCIMGYEYTNVILVSETAVTYLKTILKQISVVVLMVGLVLNGCGDVKTSMEVVVTDYSGAPLNNAKVVSISAPEGQIALMGVTTKGSNRVTFKDIKMGEYQLQISALGYDSQYINVTVESGRVFAAKVFLVKIQVPTNNDMQGE
jgi:hypothetical protein